MRNLLNYINRLIDQFSLTFKIDQRDIDNYYKNKKI